MAAVVAGRGRGGAFRSRVEARIGRRVDGRGGLGRHVERALGGLALRNELWQHQRLHFAHLWCLPEAGRVFFAMCGARAPSLA